MYPLKGVLKWVNNDMLRTSIKGEIIENYLEETALFSSLFAVRKFDKINAKITASRSN